MLKLTDHPLSPDATTNLAAYQADVDSAGTYADVVSKAKSLFSSRNRASNSTFSEVREKLALMCNGPRRCMYCEDSVADEVEHFKPKDLYPEVVFVWQNYFYACGRCNGPKNNRFSVIDGVGTLVDVTRPRDAAIVPPLAGTAALIDPRIEDPMTFMMLDLRDTFTFTATADVDSIEAMRANYTIDVLRLNERDYLVEARAIAFSGYRAGLTEYVSRKIAGADLPELDRLRSGILRAPHPTVWAEMVRQHSHHPALNSLFAAAPEALTF